MKIKQIIILAILFLIVLIVGILIGMMGYRLYMAGLNQQFSTSIYSCHDGCSIATKNSDGFLTNATWDCWNKCNDYVVNILKELK